MKRKSKSKVKSQKKVRFHQTTLDSAFMVKPKGATDPREGPSQAEGLGVLPRRSSQEMGGGSPSPDREVMAARPRKDPAVEARD